MTALHPFEQAYYQRRKQRGFTLIELLVVVFIIGLMSGYAVLSLNTGGAKGGDLDQEIRRLHSLLRLASQEAILQGREVGVLIYDDHYEFVVAGLDQWESPQEGRSLKPRNLPAGWRLELTQEGRVTPPFEAKPKAKAKDKEEGEESEKAEMPTPQIIFFSSGEGTAFELRIHSDDAVSVESIRGEESGNLELSSHGSQA